MRNIDALSEAQQTTNTCGDDDDGDEDGNGDGDRDGDTDSGRMGRGDYGNGGDYVKMTLMEVIVTVNVIVT